MIYACVNWTAAQAQSRDLRRRSSNDGSTTTSGGRGGGQLQVAGVNMHECSCQYDDDDVSGDEMNKDKHVQMHWELLGVGLQQ